MKKIGIIICDRYRSCGGGKCFRALRERRGGFARYVADEPVWDEAGTKELAVHLLTESRDVMELYN